MKAETYRCDVCGKQKGEVNHWWLMHSWLELRLIPWNDEVENLDFWDFHLCGAECVQKKVNEFLSKVSP